MGVNYKTYSDYVGEICKTNNLSNFKCNPNYTYMLEHVNYNEGLEYLTNILKVGISYEDILEYCNINDSLGNPNKVNYGKLAVSPTSLRYIFQAYLIIDYIQKLNLPSIDIVEIGGGYGGLCIAIHFFLKKLNININSYSIVDLENITNLQNKYISSVYPLLNINYINSDTYGSTIEKNNLFLVSNYCFSEIDNVHQQMYIKLLFPKVSHGFITWNNIPLYNFGFDYKEVPEYPSTAATNKYVYF